MSNNNQRLYLDIHILQTVPPSCVNRDDTGSPKTAVYGGVTRARVSSQCWKRAVRLHFRDEYPKEELGVRTKRVLQMVTDEIRALEPETNEEKALKLAVKALEAAGLQNKAKKGEDWAPGALFFISYAQAKALAVLALQDNIDKKEAQKALKDFPAVDVALFGRMVADDPSLNTDACCQVAHSISTHAVSNEYDYFTAVDDLSPDDNAGAGMIGTVEYNSSTLYRYATVALHNLKAALGTETAAAARSFANAFALSMPSGKVNTFANFTPPDAVIITLREDHPVNLAGAFEAPIVNHGEGYAADTVKKLREHANKIDATFGSLPALELEAGEELPLPALLENLEAEIAARLGEPA
ncbi:MAG: type I-E CRISPR-associated protein Cas7/Cse4/CasC [Oscillospiraceae bacterium]|jgi:CRISPR system Cascade subunit CasC|nr:type I-E CRISPR-associated protein Cas7/Cse4/CasC [Oscillospiraceae bacterium]